MIALLLACLQTSIPELRLPFECPAEVLEIRIDGSRDLLEQYIRVDLLRSDLDDTSHYPLRTIEASDAAFAALYWLRRHDYAPTEYQWTLEDSRGLYICTVRIEGDTVIGGDCSGAGRGKKEKGPVLTGAEIES